MRVLIDYLLWPCLIIGPTMLAGVLLNHGVPNVVMTLLVVGALVVLVAILERVRPERIEHIPLDQPLWIEAGHLLFGLELGYALALSLCVLVAQSVREFLHLPMWPSNWPITYQLIVGLLLYELASYWQHRLAHLVPRFWRFHALHHSGARLNLARTGRFHIIDVGTAAFMGYLSLMLLAAPDYVLAQLGVLLSALGILQHANLRIRTPNWLDHLVCTPAVHRHHHSCIRAESDSNYGNSLMVFDLLFNSFRRPHPQGPEGIGIEGDAVPRGFLRQVLSPLFGKWK